jgi:hypothetical protein
MGLQCIYNCTQERNFPPAGRSFGRAEMPHEADLRNYQRPCDEVYAFPAQSQNLTDPQSGHNCKQDDGTVRLIAAMRRFTSSRVRS